MLPPPGFQRSKQVQFQQVGRLCSTITYKEAHICYGKLKWPAHGDTVNEQRNWHQIQVIWLQV